MNDIPDRINQKIKKLFLFVFFCSLTIVACSSDDDSSNPPRSQVVNITFDITTSRNTEAIRSMNSNSRFRFHLAN